MVVLQACINALCGCLRYVVVECEDQDTQQRDPKTQMYLNVMMRFSQALLKVRTSGGGACLTTNKSSCWSVPPRFNTTPPVPSRATRA